MGITDKFLNFLKITDTEDYDDMMDDEDEDDYVPPKKTVKESAPRRRNYDNQEIKIEKEEAPVQKPVQRSFLCAKRYTQES